MFEKIVSYLETRMEQNAVNPVPFDRRHVAVAALLVEASRLDGHYDAVEQGTVIRLLRDALHLPPEEARNLLSLAEIRQANTYDDWIFCQAINRGYSIDDRKDILAKLWEVALADGQLHRLEKMMLDRVAKELQIPEADAARIKDKAFAAKPL
jgi:uncharacterized tellurite resistance protein B-like protein